MKCKAPPGWPTVLPRIFVSGPQSVAGFIKEVFAATGEFQEYQPSEIHIDESVILIAGNKFRGDMPACLYIYVTDTDITYDRALLADTRSIEAPCQTPYGDRRATVKDPWGNLWQIATRAS